MVTLQDSLNIDQDATVVSSDLYDSLFLQSLLQHGAYPQGKDAKTRHTHEDTRTNWHRFLDDLCSLCDSQCGGKSVVSIGVEQRSDHNIFWISTAPQYQQDAEAHLVELLSLLTEFPLEGANSHFAVAEMTRRSVLRSKRRVHNYARKLRQLVCTQLSGREEFHGSGCRSTRHECLLHNHQTY
jgi:hypothetical protein